MLKKFVLVSIVSAAALLAGPCCDENAKKSEGMGCKTEKSQMSGKACGGSCNKDSKSNKCCGKKGDSKGCNSGKGCSKKEVLPNFIMTELELTADQKAKVADISKKYSAKMSEMPKAHDVKPMNFVKEGKFDKEAFVAKHNETTSNMAKLKAEMFEEIFAVLSDKQKAELSEIVNFKK